jgi:pimeloyl-ACP methyl ester carboxylesterase
MAQTIAVGEGAPPRARVHRLRAPGSEDVSLGLIERRRADRAVGRTPVLVVHGSTLGAALFDLPLAGYSLLSALAEGGRAAYAIDVRGYGLSLNGPVMDAPADANPPFATLEQAVSDIGAAVDFIRERDNVKAVSLLGSSWGTITAALYATRHPQFVSRLVLYAPLYADRNEAWLDRIADASDRSRLHPRFGAYLSAAETPSSTANRTSPGRSSPRSRPATRGPGPAIRRPCAFPTAPSWTWSASSMAGRSTIRES